VRKHDGETRDGTEAVPGAGSNGGRENGSADLGAARGRRGGAVSIAAAPDEAAALTGASVAPTPPSRSSSEDDEDAGGVRAFRSPAIATSSAEALIFRCLQTVALVLLVIVTGRLMEPEGRGLFALASLAVTLCGIPLGGVWLANGVELARARATPREILGASVVLAVVGGIATGLIALAIAPLLGDRWWLIALPAAVTPFQLLGTYLQGLYTALGHIRAVNIIALGRAVLPLVFITPPLLAGASSQLAIAFWTLSFAAVAILAFFPLRSLLGGPSLPKDRRLYRRVVSYGMKLSGTNAIKMVNERLGLLALGIFATDAAVGVYSIAVAGAQVLLLVTDALALSTFRRVSGGTRETSASLTLHTIRHTSLLAAVGGTLLFPVVLVAVPWVLGPGYEDVPYLFALLIPGAVGFSITIPLYGFFEVQALRPRVIVTAAGTALTLNLALLFAMTPLWGTWGAAAATALSSITGAIMAFRYFRHDSGATARDLIPGRDELREYLSLARTLFGRLRGAGR
jgi:O-antigen/teichoic acid export membrane protein